MAAPSKKRVVVNEMQNLENAASDDDDWEDEDGNGDGEEDMEEDTALNQVNLMYLMHYDMYICIIAHRL